MPRVQPTAGPRRQQAEYNEYASLSTYVMTYILVRRIADHRTSVWNEAKRNLAAGDAGNGRAAYALNRWVELDVCYQLLSKVLKCLQRFRSGDNLDAQVMARAELDGIGVDWSTVGRLDGGKQ